MKITQGILIKEKKEKSNIVVPQVKAIFDLAYYLEVSDLTEKHSEWMQIISFCRSNNFEKKFVCDALNAAFKPTNLEENAILWDSFTRVRQVGIGSLVRLLNFHAETTFDHEKMFPNETFKYHNEHSMFIKGIWTVFEVNRFFRDVYNFCYGNAGHTYLYKEKYLKNYNDSTVTLVRNVVTDIMPFSNPSNDKLIQVHP